MRHLLLPPRLVRIGGTGELSPISRLYIGSGTSIPLKIKVPNDETPSTSNGEGSTKLIKLDLSACKVI